jgi:hypothetical protein
MCYQCQQKEICYTKAPEKFGYAWQIPAFKWPALVNCKNEQLVDIPDHWYPCEFKKRENIRRKRNPLLGRCDPLTKMTVADPAYGWCEPCDAQIQIMRYGKGGKEGGADGKNGGKSWIRRREN